jgi:hypothetical protein
LGKAFFEEKVDPRKAIFFFLLQMIAILKKEGCKRNSTLDVPLVEIIVNHCITILYFKMSHSRYLESNYLNLGTRKNN